VTKERLVTNESTEARERLDVLIGTWKTEGLTTEARGRPAQRIDAVDTYERLPGGALLHLVDARVGDVKLDGAEIIGFDPLRGTFVTQFFGASSTQSATSSPATGMRSTTTRHGSRGWTSR